MFDADSFFNSVQMGIVEVLERWGRHEVGGYVRAGGKEWQIVYVMAHHASCCVWLVLKSRTVDGLYEYDIDYEQGIPAQEKEEENDAITRAEQGKGAPGAMPGMPDTL